MDEKTRTLLNALIAASSSDRTYARMVSGYISAIQCGIIEVPFTAHTNGATWQVWNRAEKAMFTFDIQNVTMERNLAVA